MESEWLGESEACKLKARMGFSSEKVLVGLYGWRRRCLLFLLSLLLILVLINLTLSLWMLRVMNFSLSGMGSLRIFNGGLQLAGEAMVLDKLISSKISSRIGKPIQIESSKNISLLTRRNDGRIGNRLFLGNDHLNVMATSMKIADSRGRLLFSVDRKEALVGAEVLRVTGDGGAVFDGSVQTPMVRPEAGQNLRLESPTRSLNVFALHGVNLESRAGDINVNCLTDLKLHSKMGSVKLDAPNIYLPKVPTAILSSPSTQKSLVSSISGSSGRPSYSSTSARNSGSSSHLSKPMVYQVCVCGKGRLFLAPAEGPCVADNDVCR